MMNKHTNVLAVLTCFILTLSSLFIANCCYAQSIGCQLNVISCTSNLAIENFSLFGENNTSINNTTGCNYSPINNYSNLPVLELISGKTYGFTLTPIDTFSTMKTAILIDWNQDNDYLDSYEFYNFGTNNSILNDSINVPPIISTGTYNFAVLSVLDFSGANSAITQINYCDSSYLFGELEEYSLEIIQACVGIEGCTNPIYCEYNPIAYCDNGSCEIVAIDGCTDSNYCEYNPNANCDDGSCLTSNQNPGNCDSTCVLGIYEIWNPQTCECEIDSTIISGCTDVNYCEFNPNANCDDGSCLNSNENPGFCDSTCVLEIYEIWNPQTCECEIDSTIISGCTDVNYCEFNPNANCDDGSCLTQNIDPLTCNLDCTIGNIEVWNSQICECEYDANSNKYYSELSIDSLNGSYGLKISDINTSVYLSTVSNAGDFNNDGIDDFLFGASLPWIVNKTYIIYGKNNFNKQLEIDNLKRSDGFIIAENNMSDFTGYSASAAGDFNNDGFDDVIIAANPTSNKPQRFYIVYGNNSLDSIVNVSSLNQNNSFVIYPNDTVDNTEFNFASAGDVNGDDYDDIIFGLPRTDNPTGFILPYASYPDINNFNQNRIGLAKYAGQVHIIYGNSNLQSEVYLDSLTVDEGFKIYGLEEGDQIGSSVSAAGDMNNDGFDDIVFGAPLASPLSNPSIGKSYVVFGGQNINNVIDLYVPNDNVLIIIGAVYGGRTGRSVSGAGDFNKDGFDDIIIGAPLAEANGNINCGINYVIYGAGSYDAYLNLNNLNGSNGFRIYGEDVFVSSGISVDNAGDLNSDGYDDIFIANFANNESFIVFGEQNIGDAIALNDLSTYNGIKIFGRSDDNNFGRNGSFAGDVNNDGFADFIIGAKEANPNGIIYDDAVFVVFGGNKIKGCTDLSFVNYNSNANCDDGSCSNYLSIEEQNNLYIKNVFPQPTKKLLNINFFSNEMGSVSIKLNDLNGRLVLVKNFETTVTSGNQTISLSIPDNLTSGLYILTLTINNNAFVKKITIE